MVRKLSLQVKEDLMKIEILGMGCPRCEKLFEIIEKIVKETGVSAEIIKIEDAEEIARHGIVVTPAVLIDGDVKSSGNMPLEEEIKEWLIDHHGR